MELPKFRSQAGVSMDSARVSAARISAPPQVRANTKTFRPTTTAAFASAQASKPTGLDAALEVGAMLIKHAEEVDQTNQNMAVKAAQAEYKNHMAFWHTDYASKANEINPDTNRPYWESFEEEYEAAAGQAKNIFREKYNFKGKARELEWKLNTDSTDSAYRQNTIKVVSQAKTREAQANYKTAAANATSLNELKSLNEVAVKQGLIYQAEANAIEEQYEINSSFKMYIRTADSMSHEEAVNMREMAKNPDSKFSDAQRTALRNASNNQIINLHMGAFDQVVQDDGLIAGAKYIEGLQMAGPEATLSEDMISHNKLVNILQSQLGNYRQQKKDLKEAQGAGTTVNSFMRGTNGNDHHLYYVLKKDKKSRDALDASVNQVLLNMDEQGMTLNSEPGKQLITRSAQINFTPDALEHRVESLILDTNPTASGAEGTIMGTVQAMMYGEQLNPHMWDGLSGESKQKFDFYKGAIVSGRGQMGDMSDLEKQYKDFTSMGKDETKRRTDNGRAMLSPKYKSESTGNNDNTPADRFARQADEHIKTGWFSSPPQASMGAEAMFADNFIHYYKMTQNEAAAEKLAYEATTKRYGISLVSGDEEWTLDAPSAVLGMKPELINKQHVTLIEEYNAGRDIKISPTDVRQLYVGKRKSPETGEMTPTWALLDKLNQTLTWPDGAPVYATYDDTDPEVVAEQGLLNQAAQFRNDEAQMLAIVANSGIQLPANESLLGSWQRHQDGVHMFEYSPEVGAPELMPSGEQRTPTAFTVANVANWETYSREEREIATTQYQSVHAQLMEAVMSSTVYDYSQADYMVRHYMNSRGYMEGDVDGSMIMPPAMN